MIIGCPRNLDTRQNLYGYCLADPVNLVDPSGLITVPLSMTTPGIAYQAITGRSADVWIPLGEQTALSAVYYWADLSIQPDNAWYETAGYTTMGVAAAFWTPCASDWTLAVVGMGLGGGARGAGSAGSAESETILPYREARQLTGKGTGLEAHHLIEKRFAGLFGQNPGDMLSTPLSRAAHQTFTSEWRTLIPYGEGTAMATRSSVEAAARAIYASHPAYLEALGL